MPKRTSMARNAAKLTFIDNITGSSEGRGRPCSAQTWNGWDGIV